jgi:2-keto-3-deoxygluconate permease
MPIMRFINYVPGGLMVAPLFIGMLINTFTSGLLKIGGFTEGLSNTG